MKTDWVELARSASGIYQTVCRTPLSFAPRLSAELGQQVWIKREDLQPVHSFKIRGAMNALLGLQSRGVRRVCAASAGNHAQGLALGATTLGMEATIFMPVTTPEIKVEAVLRLGARVELRGDGYDDSCSAALEHARLTGDTFVHPFDDRLVIAGQATIGLEIMEQADQPPDRVFLPVGGGGLLAGVGAVIKARFPSTRIVAVECSEAPSFSAALDAGRPVSLPPTSGFADGIAVATVGEQTFAVAREIVDDVVHVTPDQICAAVRDVYNECRAVLEPAGAAAIAGMRALEVDHTDERWVAIASGANVNFDRLGHIVERAELGAARETLFAATIPEKPGAFLEFCRCIGNSHAITEFNYRFQSPTHAHVLVGVKAGGDASGQILRKLESHYEVFDLTANETAKAHIRHMIGGRPDLGLPERVFRFRFPERPGALLDFLTRLAGRWNISLFHYRNHGSSFGRVLVGFMVADADQEAFADFINATGYDWVEDTNNPAYGLFSAAQSAPAAISAGKLEVV